jgi:hypothetical protein
MKIVAELYSVGEADLSVTAPRRNGSLVGGDPGAAAAAAAASAASCVRIATSRALVPAAASSSTAPGGYRAADRASV